MSEKPTVAKHAVAKSVEEAEESVRESTEYCLGKKQMSEKKPMKDTNEEDTKKEEKVTKGHETTETSPSIETTSEISISNKPENPEPTKKCEISKTTSEISISIKLETPKIPEVYENTETTSETSTKSQVPEPKGSEVCQIAEYVSKISASDKSDNYKCPEKRQGSKITSEESISTKPEVPEESENPEIREMGENMSKISAESEAGQLSKKCQVLKPMSEESTFIKPEVAEESENPEVHQMTKDTFKISASASAKSDDPEYPKAAHQMIEDMFTICTRDPEMYAFAENLGMRVSRIPSDESISTESDAFSKLSVSKISAKSENYYNNKLLEMFEMLETSSTTSGESTLNESNAPEKPEERQMTKDMSKMSTSDESEGKVSEIINLTKIVNANIFCKTLQKHCESKMFGSTKTVFEFLKAYQSTSETAIAKTEESEIPEVSSSRISTPSELAELEDSITDQTHSSTSERSTSFQFEDEINLAKRFTDDNSEIPIKKLKGSPIEETKSLANNATKKIIFKEKERPLVLATHRLVPSLPIELFEVLAEIIEVVAKRPVLLAHEWRDLRPISMEIVDIVVMQPDENWEHGVLLPASFIFDHHLNKDTTQPGIYVDVVVPRDRDSHIKDIMNLRGCKCAFPAKQSSLTAVGVLLRYLQLKGESIYYFGNISDAKTQLEALEMVINQEAQVAVLEAPVIKCHKSRLRNIDSVDILASLGPLPPYRIMVKKTLADESNLIEDLTTYLIDIHENEDWMERLMSFGILGFCLTSQNMYDEARKKYPVLSSTYY